MPTEQTTPLLPPGFAQAIMREMEKSSVFNNYLPVYTAEPPKEPFVPCLVQPAKARPDGSFLIEEVAYTRELTMNMRTGRVELSELRKVVEEAAPLVNRAVDVIGRIVLLCPHDRLRAREGK
jgi:hypothetical protein